MADLGLRPAASTDLLLGSSAASARVPNWARMVLAMERYDLMALGRGVESEAPGCGGSGIVLEASSKLQGRGGGGASRESVALSSTTGPDNNGLERTRRGGVPRLRGAVVRVSPCRSTRC